MSPHERWGEMLARRSELAPEDVARLEEHLGSCPECRELDRVYAAQTTLLRSLPVVQPASASRFGVVLTS